MYFIVNLIPNILRDKQTTLRLIGLLSHPTKTDWCHNDNDGVLKFDFFPPLTILPCRASAATSESTSAESIDRTITRIRNFATASLVTDH